MKRYRIRVAGKIFENSDPKVLIKHAVAAKRSTPAPVACAHCGRHIGERELARFGYCIGCIEQAVAVFQQRRRLAAV